MQRKLKRNTCLKYTFPFSFVVYCYFVFHNIIFERMISTSTYNVIFAIILKRFIMGVLHKNNYTFVYIEINYKNHSVLRKINM